MGQSSERKKDNRNILIAGIIVKIVGFLYRIPLTNLLGDEGQGYLSLALELYILFLFLSSYAMSDSMSCYIKRKIKNDRDDKEAFLKAVIPVSIYSLLIALIFSGFSNHIAKNLLSAPYVAYPMKILAPAIFLFSITQCLRGYFKGINAYAPSLISRIIEQIITAVVALIGAKVYLREGNKLASKNKIMALKAATGAKGAALGTLVGVIAGLLFLVFIFIVYKKKGKRKKALRHERVRIAAREMFEIASPMILGILAVNVSGPLNALFYSRIASVQGASTRDIVINYGLYDAKCGVWLRLPMGLAITLGLLTLSGCEGEKTRDRTISEVFRNAMLVAVIGAVTLFVFGGSLVACFYKGEVLLPGRMIRISAVTIILYTLGTVSDALLRRMGNGKLAVKIAGISLLIHLVSLLVFLVIFKLGIMSVIISNIISGASYAFITLRLLEQKTRYRFNFRGHIIMPLVVSLFASIPGLICYGIIRLIGSLETATTVGFIVYVIWLPVMLTKYLVLRPEDMKIIPFGRKLYVFLKNKNWI